MRSALLRQLAAIATTVGHHDTTGVLRLAVPRTTDAAIAIDGRLDEPAWQKAAVLREFSQYLPTDSRPADDSTVVRVWYSATAIYFGIRAYQDSATVRATLADRDKIAGDDHVELLLDTFNDQHEALVFGVNPLGVQSDGTLVDAPRQVATTLSAASTGAYVIDLSPDFVYESKGHVTAWGYEVEIRIPFKTLRFQGRAVQDWGINVMRTVQASGHLHTWTRVLQSSSSFLAQEGTLVGLTGLHRGLVLDLTPEATSTVTGSPAPGGWQYGGGAPRLGVTARWGVGSNLTLNATIHPDFSQIESDVPQLQFDPRNATDYPEKRPFFLDGLDLFSSPVQLIYTRTLVDPQAAAKFAGKAGGTTIAMLSGVDGTDASASGHDSPLTNAVRLSQDIGGQNRIGLVYTDRIDGDGFNHVAALDGHVRFGRTWDGTWQAGGSVTRDSAGTAPVWGPVWRVAITHAGREFALAMRAQGLGTDFRTESGFISRNDYAYVAAIPSYTIIGKPGALIESINANVFLGGTWLAYHNLSSGQAPDDRQADFSTGFTLRGGWQLGIPLSIESFGYQPSLFANDWIERRRGTAVDTIPFTGTPHLHNLDHGLNVQTPNFHTFSLTASVLAGRDENFLEWANAHIVLGNIDLAWRPTSQLRTELIYSHQQVNRIDDGTLVQLIRVPRLEVDYQLTRSIFVRVIGQYTAIYTDSLRDDSRTNDPLLVRDPVTGAFSRTMASSTNLFRVDWLFSDRPTPGTVLFLGYGSSLDDAAPFRFQRLVRTTDGFFVKFSYLFRL